MSVAFDGIGACLLTFKAGQVAKGDIVAMTDNDTVGKAADAAAPAGIVLNKRMDWAAVQVAGYAEVAYSGTAPKVGWNSLVADGNGGLRTAADKEMGRACLVVSVDSENTKMGLFL